MSCGSEKNILFLSAINGLMIWVWVIKEGAIIRSTIQPYSFGSNFFFPTKEYVEKASFGFGGVAEIGLAENGYNGLRHGCEFLQRRLCSLQ